MTLERPMFPPRAEQSNVIDFKSILSRKQPEKLDRSAIDRLIEMDRGRREARLIELKESPERLSPTCRNQRMRLVRRDEWNKARRETEYWLAAAEWANALQIGQMYDVADAKSFAKAEPARYFALVDLWRVALCHQMLVPAPDALAVTWKKAQLRRYLVNLNRVPLAVLEKAIADDTAWLANHPTRKGRAS